MASVHLAGVSRVFPGGVTALSGIDLQVEERELLVVVGPSGCGKSTLLRLIAGLDQPTAGRIEIGRRDMRGVAPRDRNVAMVFQEQALYPHLTVAENIAFGLKMRQSVRWWQRWTWLYSTQKFFDVTEQAGKIESKVYITARMLGIAELLQRLPGELSGGERQRVALGRALVCRPDVCLLDEPLSDLDAPLRAELQRELKKLQRWLAEELGHVGCMIHVTHDQAEAMTLGDRIVVLDRGAVQQIGRPDEVYDSPENDFVARFIGSPPMNLLPGELQGDEKNLRFTAGTWSIQVDRGTQKLVQQYAGRPILLGLRAEDIRLSSSLPVEGAADPITCEVLLVESHGDSAIAQLRLGPTDKSAGLREGVVLCRIAARSRLTPGTRTEAYFDMRRAHLFDPATGRNISRRETA